jgi:hypothetical protein
VNLIDEILSTAPKHEPEFEARVYDVLGRLVAILPMEKSDGDFYQSVRYEENPCLAIVTLFRDGVAVQVIAYGVELHPGYFVRADIPDPYKGLTAPW